MARVTEFAVRPATTDDLPMIEALVIAMFRDLGTNETPPTWAESMRTEVAARLGRDVGAYVTADDVNRPVAVAIGVVDRRLPSPRRPTGRIGYVEWLATDPAHRRRGAARMALGELLSWFDRQGITAVDVHASASARPLYLDLGFAAPAAIPLRRSR
jgi:GNAT superfamily N-acetyltransferase